MARKCEECTEWEYFEGYGYGCYYRQTMTPIDADKFLKDNEAYTGWILNSSECGGENAYKDTLEDLVNEAPTIIEADKED